METARAKHGRPFGGVRSRLDRLLNRRDDLYSFVGSVAPLWKAFNYVLAQRRVAALRKAAPPTPIISLGNLRMHLDPSEPHDLRLFELAGDRALYEPETSAFVAEHLAEGDSFADVGANNGYFSLLAAGLVGPRGVVYAFEPAAPAFSRLLRNVELNQAVNVRPYRLAIGARDGAASLHRSREEDGLNSLVPLGSIGSARDKDEVQVRPLDKVVGNQPLHLIKVDVEGTELEVLQGATRVIRRSPRIAIVMEHSRAALRRQRRDPDEVLGFVRSLGLSTYELFGPGLRREVRSHHDLSRGLTNLCAFREDSSPVPAPRTTPR